MARAARTTLRAARATTSFQYRFVTDSKPGGGEDLITDFRNADLIDLSAIDANVGAPGDDAFTFVASFSRVPRAN